MVTLNSVPEPNNEKDPRYHAQNIQRMLREVMDHAREDVSKVDDPKAQALYETTAEVLGGLATAYEHYLQRSEEAWR
ncbi:MAG: hypothetical protein GX613_07550 [Chloroflexi bacterium]|nr:hypothetical protein [Chloroflexota bacterium]